MNLLSALETTPAARAVHSRLATVLMCSKHRLLNASADVWEPGEVPEPKPKKSAIAPEMKDAKREPVTPIIFAFLSERPIGAREICRKTGFAYHTVVNTLSKLKVAGRANNLRPAGTTGQWVRAAPKSRGVFDV